MSGDGSPTVTLSEETYKRIERRLGHTTFDSVDAYVDYVLDELTLYVDERVDADATETVDEEEVRERLNSLGYLRD